MRAKRARKIYQTKLKLLNVKAPFKKIKHRRTDFRRQNTGIPTENKANYRHRLRNKHRNTVLLFAKSRNTGQKKGQSRYTVKVQTPPYLVPDVEIFFRHALL